MSQSFGQSPSDLFRQGLEMADQALINCDMYSFANGLQLMEKAQKKDKKRADWCYEIGCKYYYYVSFGNDSFAWDRAKGIKWFKDGAKLGDIKSALALYKHYKPESSPCGILSSESERKQYFKERDECLGYAGIALRAEIPSGFNDYLSLSEAARYTGDKYLANCYAAKAAENNEYGAIDYLIKDERALDYLTSPAVMFEAANKMWKRDKNDGHNDRINGFIWFEKSAKAGYSLAQNQMGYIYLKGITVEPDTLKAVSWYKLAAKNNEAEAISALGRLYINGKGVDKDAEHGFQLLNESADKGHLNSKLYLAYCYLYGLGTNRNTQHARILFQKYFDNFNHEPEQRVIVVDNRVIDLDYLIGLTYYFENSPKCIPLFEASMQSKTFDRLQRGDLLRKLAFCYSDGKCGKHVDKATSDRLLSDAVNYGHFEITANNIIISFL